eukprot:GEZU01015323.1.p1 GENE.GEZU01015323.1~~GEZU01015323.1.p1  ORF type:complete len:274 (+),score=97.22 GEZU01015323.1:204-1025(+)
MIGFIGAGAMATAIIKGVIDAKIVKPADIIASDVYAPMLDKIKEQTGINVTMNNIEIAEKAKVIFIAVKPNDVDAALQQIKDKFTSEHLLISIAAGITIRQLEKGLPSKARIARVMPNTACLVGASASAFAMNSHATEEDKKRVEDLFSAVGTVSLVPEKLLDAVTGLSGSGPAYVYEFIESLADGGVRAGLPRATAIQLAAQTVFGSAKMVLENKDKHTAQLKDAVCSPGGTTITGVHELEKGCFRGTVMNAVLAATNRATELGQQQQQSKL